MGDYRVRFRHAHGDVGPFSFSPLATVEAMKARVKEEWPVDGPLALNTPTSLAEVRLISCGKFAENQQTLGALCKVLGPPAPDLIVTLHVIVRPPSASKGSAKHASDDSAAGCCIIT